MNFCLYGWMGTFEDEGFEFVVDPSLQIVFVLESFFFQVFEAAFYLSFCGADHGFDFSSYFLFLILLML